MEKLSFYTEIIVFEEIENLPEQDKILLLKSKEALKYSYSPYSGFKVGSAALLQNGKYVLGTNLENASYSLSICAERTVLTSINANYSNIPVLAMAITAENPQKPISRPVAPCGACRQVIHEMERKLNHPIRLILQGEKGKIYVLNSGKDLLPLAFDESFLY